jgi:hypothetical protein
MKNTEFSNLINISFKALVHKTKSILTNPYAGLPIGRFYSDLSGFLLTLSAHCIAPTQQIRKF